MGMFGTGFEEPEYATDRPENHSNCHRGTVHLDTFVSHLVNPASFSIDLGATSCQNRVFKDSLNQKGVAENASN